MRAREFLLEYDLKVSKDADGVAIKATAGGKQLGHAEFFFDEQGRLDPQTVWVDERFHGQGIAADMYDHLKSLGYTIIRSWDQTDAGRGFWNKHRGPDATVWESQQRLPAAIEEFLDSLNPDDCGVEDIGAYRIHFEGFTSDCKSSADYRKNPEAVYQQVYQDFIQREGGRKPLIQDMVGSEDFPILFSIFRRKKSTSLKENPLRGRPPTWSKNLQSAKVLQKELITLAKKINNRKATEKEFDSYLTKMRELQELGYTLGAGGILVVDPDNLEYYHAPPAGTNINENKQATAKQVLAYINQTHHEPFRPGEKMYAAVMAHPRWQLKQVPLLNLNIPDQEYDDVDYDEYEPEADPYGRVMTVEPGHAGEVSQHLVDRQPIVIDADRYIIDGNHRAWAAKYLLNRDYINAWVPVTQIKEVNYPDELSVSDQIQEYFFRRGYELAGEGRDQMAFESPRGTILKVLGIGEDEREQIVKSYVKFFERNQQNPFYPRIFNSGNFTVDGETYFVYEMERVNYVANEEATLDYIEKLMSAVDRGQGAEYVKKNPVPDEIGVKQLAGLLQATEHMMQALGGTAPLDLSAVENLGRRDNGHLVIVDPYSL